jgi:hypothetical protein
MPGRSDQHHHERGDHHRSPDLGDAPLRRVISTKIGGQNR